MQLNDIKLILLTAFLIKNIYAAVLLLFIGYISLLYALYCIYSLMKTEIVQTCQKRYILAFISFIDFDIDYRAVCAGASQL